MRRAVVAEITPQARHLSTFTAEFVVRAHYAGYRVRDVPVHHYARKIGSTTIYFVSNLFWICLQQFRGLLKLKQEFRQRELHPPVCPAGAGNRAETGARVAL